MVNKLGVQSSKKEEHLDDAWWSALLAEEERVTSLSADRAVNYYTVESKETKTQTQEESPSLDWDLVQRLYECDETVCLRVNSYNRGGLLAGQDGIYGFIPFSHLVDMESTGRDGDRENRLSEYIGQTLCVKVIECDPDRGRLVFSQRAATAGAGRRKQIFEALTVGQCVQGKVTNITDFGIFVDIGGVEGLIHVSELSWGRVRHPSDLATIGQRIDALVLNMDRERSRVALSLKRNLPNPWQMAERRYRPGQVLEATISSIVPFGAFARLEEGLDGLIHVSEMGLPGEQPDPHQMLIEGQTVKVRVLHVDASKQRLGLSLEMDE